MAYTIKRTNGNTITIEDNALNTTYGVQLIGKNRLGYGTSLNQNFFRLMENFSYSSAPSNPVSGQLWWDTAGFLKVYTGSVWKEVSSALVSEPATPVNGDLWLDTVNAQLKAYNGTTGTWITVGPSNATTGILNGFVTEAVTIGGTDYYVASMYANSERIAILSKDTLSGTGNTFSGFSNLNVGLNFRSGSNSAIHNANVFTTSGTFTGNVSSDNLSAAGNLSVTGNANVGNLDAARGVFSSAVTSTSTTTGAVVIAGGLGVAGNVNAAGNVSAGNLAATGAAITGNVSMGNISVTNISNLGGNTNVKITGGTNGQILSTDGTGNLAWINPTAGTINTGNTGRFAYYTGATALSETSANLTWTAGTNTLSLTGNLQATNLTVTSNVAVSGNLIYADATNSRIGVGTTSPSYKTHIYQVDTAFSGNTASGGGLNTNLYNQFLITPSSNPTVPLSYFGSWNDTSYNSSANGTNVTIISSLIRPIENGIGNVATMVGLSEDTRVTSSGNVTTSYGILTQLNLVSSGSVGTHYSLYISNPTKSSTGNLVTNYGLYLASQTTGNTTNWGIYSAGGSNYFGGNILVGTTTPSANLTVNGTSNLGPIGNVTITGGSSGWVLSTNGSGGLSWINPAAGVTSISNGTSNIALASNGNMSVSVSGTSNVLVVGSAVTNIVGNANISGNVSGGNLSTSGNVTAGFFIGNGSQLTGITVAAGTSLVNGTSNVIVTSSGAVSVSSAGTSNVLVVSNTGANIAGAVSVTGNATMGNLSTAGNITASYFFGNGSQLTGITVAAGTSLINGTSNVIVASSGAVSVSSAGTSNVLVVSNTGANIAGAVSVTGNANVGNIGATRGVFTNISGTLETASQTNITAVGTLTALTVSGNLTVDTNTLFVDATNNRVGIGTTSPAIALDLGGGSNWINGVTAYTNILSSAKIIQIYDSSQSVLNIVSGANTDGGVLGGILFSRSLGQGDAHLNVAGITAVQKSTGTLSGAELLFYTKANGAPLERMRIDTNGNVGIGTTTPAYTLDVKASVNTGLRVTNSGASDNVQIRFRGNQTNAEQWAIGNEVATGGTGRNFDIYDLASSVNRLRIDSGGNVGIGTSSPGHKLDVRASSARIFNGTASADTILHVGNSDALSGQGMYATFHGSAATPYASINVLSQGAAWRNLSLSPNGGNVGIGTSTPDGKLAVVGGRSYFSAASEPYGVGARYISTGGAVYFGATNGTATPDAQISAAGGGALMTLQNGGNVGIGTSSPGHLLDIQKTTGDAVFRSLAGTVDVRSYASQSYSVGFTGTFSAHDFLFMQNATERMRIASTGINVGGSNPTDANFAIFSTGLTYIPLTVNHTASTTNDAPVAMQLKRLSSGTPTAGMGCTFQFALQDAGGSQIGTHQIVSAWSNAAAANRETSLRINYSKANVNYEALRIDTDGNVGIGTSNPLYKLDVTGTVRLSSFGFGTILADTTGVLSSVKTLPVGIATVLVSSTLSSGYNYIIGANSIILTLPSNPAQGDKIGFVPRPNITSYTISRNGKNIMALAENLTIDLQRPFALVYDDETNGWLIAHA